MKLIIVVVLMSKANMPCGPSLFKLNCMYVKFDKKKKKGFLYIANYIIFHNDEVSKCKWKSYLINKILIQLNFVTLFGSRLLCRLSTYNNCNLRIMLFVFE